MIARERVICDGCGKDISDDRGAKFISKDLRYKYRIWRVWYRLCYKMRNDRIKRPSYPSWETGSYVLDLCDDCFKNLCTNAEKLAREKEERNDG